HPPRIRKQAVQNEPVEPVVILRRPGGGFGRSLIGAEGLNETAVLDSRRAGGFTTAAIEAEGEGLFDFTGQFESAVPHGPHQIDAPAGAVILVPRFQIRRTRRRAESAVNAIEELFVVDCRAYARGRLSGGRWRRGWDRIGHAATELDVG